MLEIRRWKANRTYENIFFRDFAKNLKNFFDNKLIDWLLIANSVCELDETLQIDALLITNRSICIIDFKNFWWKINLPNNEYSFWHIQWTDWEWTIIKWGSSINPYSQLYKQKGKFSSIVKEYILKWLEKNDYLNPSHTKKIVCFQKTVEIIWNIPKKDEIDFLIMDSWNYLEVLKDSIDIDNKEVKLSSNSFSLFKKYFKADEFEVNEIYLENTEPNFTNYSKILNYDWLEIDQKEALLKIEDFIKNKNDKIFILKWSTLSWKTHLINFIEDIAFKNNIIDVENIVQSARIARNLLLLSNIKFDSMYSIIYWWNKQNVNNEDEVQDDSISWNIEIIPIKQNVNSDYTLYIIDESQLIWDSYNENFELRFWSWMLLKDFLKFVDLEKSNRKVIFIWDIFQIKIWKENEWSLYKDYLKKEYSIDNIKFFELNDKEDKHFIWTQLFNIIKNIRENTFNNLDFQENNNLSIIKKKEILEFVNNKLKNNIDFHILNFSNHDSNKINLWIKKEIIKNWIDLNKGDLVLINNNISVPNQDDPFSSPQKVYNWEFWIIEEVSNNLISEKIIIDKKDWKSIYLNFREVKIKLKLSWEIVKLYSFENYRLSDKWEISQDEIKAYNIILNTELKENYEKNPFDISLVKNISNYDSEKIFVDKLIYDWKIKVENDNQKTLKKAINKIKKEDKEKRIKYILTNSKSKSYMFRNSVHLRFWWALTVHKSIWYKWDEVLINAETWLWITNETYFKWLYTALTRAKSKVYLVNFKGINCFYQISFWEQISNNDKNIFFKVDENIDLFEDDIEKIDKYNFPNDYKNMLFQFYKFIQSKILWRDIFISNIIHNNYQETYKLEDWQDYIIFSIYYTKKWEFKSLSITHSSSEEYKNKVSSLLLNDNKIKDFSFIKDEWRREVYKKLSDEFKKESIDIKYILQNKYKDLIKLSKMWESINIDMYYNSEYFFTKSVLKYSDNNEVWESFKNIIINYK